jgi:hypothetical protein
MIEKSLQGGQHLRSMILEKSAPHLIRLSIRRFTFLESTLRQSRTKMQMHPSSSLEKDGILHNRIDVLLPDKPKRI